MSCGCRDYEDEDRLISISEAVWAAVKMAKTLDPENRSSDEQVEDRGGKCRECPSRVRAVVLGKKVDFCGKPLHKTNTTCGCVVWAKIRVRSEECPQEKW